MTVFLTGFVRCPCGKVHARGGVRYDSVCTCERKLYELAFDIKNVNREPKVPARKLSAVEIARECAKALAKRQASK